MRFLCSHCENVIERQDVAFNSPTSCDHCQETTLVPASRIALGTVFGDFVVMGALGEGRICTLHHGHQLSLRREVVVQILKRELQTSRRYRQQFVNDARIMARLVHPSIVHAYAIGEEEGISYAAIERVQGRDLQSMLRQEIRLPLCHALEIARQVADAIDFAWEEHRIVHRDIKPGNILWLVDGSAKLQGFRLACTVDSLASQPPEDSIVGSPPYLCPEQLLGSPMDVRSDIYSLGATLYHLITGRLPFLGQTAEEVAWKHLDEPLVPPSTLNSFIPETVSDIVVRMMAKEPAARYATCAELRADLTKALAALDEGLPSPASLALRVHRESGPRRSIMPPIPRTGTVIMGRDSVPADLDRTFTQLRVSKVAPTEVYDPPEPARPAATPAEPNPAFESTMYYDATPARPRRERRPPPAIVRGAPAIPQYAPDESALALPDPRLRLSVPEPEPTGNEEADEDDTQRFDVQTEMEAGPAAGLEEPAFGTQDQFDLELEAPDAPVPGEAFDEYADGEPEAEDPYAGQIEDDRGYAEAPNASDGTDTVVYRAAEEIADQADRPPPDLHDEDTQDFGRGRSPRRQWPTAGEASEPGQQPPDQYPQEAGAPAAEYDPVADVKLDDDGAYELE